MNSFKKIEEKSNNKFSSILENDFLGLNTTALKAINKFLDSAQAKNLKTPEYIKETSEEFNRVQSNTPSFKPLKSSQILPKSDNGLARLIFAVALTGIIWVLYMVFSGRWV